MTNSPVIEVGTAIKTTFAALSYCTPFSSFQRFEHLENAPTPIVVTLEGIVTEVKPEHQQNARSPMEVTLEGIVTEVKPEQPSNA